MATSTPVPEEVREERGEERSNTPLPPHTQTLLKTMAKIHIAKPRLLRGESTHIRQLDKELLK